MAFIHGDNLRFYVNTGTTGTPSYTATGSEIDFTLSMNTDTIDVTNKDSSNIKEHIIGDISSSITFSGVANEGNTPIDRLITDQLARNNVLFECKTYNSEQFSGGGTITSFELSASHTNAVLFSGTLEVSGQLTQETA